MSGPLLTPGMIILAALVLGLSVIFFALDWGVEPTSDSVSYKTAKSYFDRVELGTVEGEEDRARRRAIFSTHFFEKVPYHLAEHRVSSGRGSHENYMVAIYYDTSYRIRRVALLRLPKPNSHIDAGTVWSEKGPRPREWHDLKRKEDTN